MKKLLFILFVVGILSCSSDKKDDVSKEGVNTPGIQNVNGNIPDTSNSINLDNDKTDSSAYPNSPD